MIICVCNAVTESEIRACVALGCTDLDAVREAVGVASCCGTCADCAQEVIESCRAQAAAGADCGVADCANRSDCADLDDYVEPIVHQRFQRIDWRARP